MAKSEPEMREGASVDEEARIRFDDFMDTVTDRMQEEFNIPWAKCRDLIEEWCARKW